MNRYAPMILAVALFMEQMDSTVIATSLPAIAADLAVNPITLKLAMTSYLVSLGIFIPVSGWAADRFGAKRIFITAIIVFVLGSILCAFAGSLPFFVMARFLQGMGGAMTTPVGRAILLRSTEKSQLVSAMALFTIPGVIGPLVGPPVGGFITTYFSWEWIFLINVPVGMIGIVLSALFIPRIPVVETGRFDYAGFLLSGISAACLVFGLSVISLPALPPVFGALAVAISVLTTVLFIRHARQRSNPILDLSLFNIETFRACVASGTVFRISMGAIPFLLPLMLQLGFGYTPFQSGSITFIAAAGALLTKFTAPRVFAAYGFRRVLLTAASAAGIGTLANAFFMPDTPYPAMISVLFFAGFCRSFFFTGINILGFADIDQSKAGRAAALNAVIQQISGALGVALAGLILETHSLLTGDGLTISAFHIAFVAVALVNVFAIFPIARLPASAGATVSGHQAH